MERRNYKSKDKQSKATVVRGSGARRLYRKEQQAGWVNNMVVSNVWEPFRLIDLTMIMGMHKGKKISELPKDYIKWMVQQPNLSQTRRSILIELL